MKILVIFVEPMLYGMDLIHEVYDKTNHEFQYIYTTNKLTGKDDIKLPLNAYVCSGDNKDRKKQIGQIFRNFKPDFAVINGYVGIEQITGIRYCQRHRVPYAIETDTPLHIPENKIKAFAKRIYLYSLLHNKFCYGFPGGTLQKENLVYYGIPENRNYIMPMSVSDFRLKEAAKRFPDKKEIKKEMGIDGKKVFLFVGRLVKEKDVKTLLKAFSILKTKKKESTLIIVGDGNDKKELEKYVSDYKIEDVIFSGYTVFPELIKYYKVADVFVLPSIYEPWGLVVNEAMIMDLRVIVSDCVGCRVDLIKNKKNIFKSGDSIQLADLMDQEGCNEKTILIWNYSLYKENFNKMLGEL